MQNASIIPAATSMTVNAQVMNSGATLAQQAFTSSLEYQSQQYWNAQNLQMQKQALNAQKHATDMGVLGSFLGAGAQLGGSYMIAAALAG